MTRTTPRLRMTLHRSQRVLTDADTFIASVPPYSPYPGHVSCSRTFRQPLGRCLISLSASATYSTDDPSSRKIERRHRNANPIPRQEPDEVHPQLTGDMCDNRVSVVGHDPEQPVREDLDDTAFDLDASLPWHADLSVTRK